MTRRLFALIAIVVLVAAPTVQAKKCRSNSQCGKCGFCFNGVCAPDPAWCGACETCDPSTFRCKPEADGSFCGSCGECESNTCLANDSRCGQCQVCNPTTLGCTAAPDGPSTDCGPGGACCGGGCVDTQSDPDNCGSCGYKCPQGQDCYHGSCFCPGTALPCPPTGACCDSLQCQTCGQDGTCHSACGPCEECQGGACVPKQCGACEACDATTGQCTSTCGGGQVCCSDTCVTSRNPPGGVCCEWNGDPFACGPTEQCAGAFGCCAAGAQVCVGTDGSAQCCTDGSSCVMTESGAPACCTLGASDPSVCCGYGNCLPKECCRPS